jgi:hypothetical protein
MAAPKNNQFWKMRDLKSRQKIFSTPELLLEAAYEYFKQCDENPWYKNEAIKSGMDAGKIIPIPVRTPYTFTGLYVYLGVDRTTYENYEKAESYKVYFPVTKHIRGIIEQNQLEGASVGAYNPNIIARLLWLVDKTETKTEHSVSQETMDLLTEVNDRLKRPKK